MGMKNSANYLSNNGKPITAVFDRGRRGNPLAGCDCVQCFGYCMINGDEAVRARFKPYDQPKEKDLK